MATASSQLEETATAVAERYALTADALGLLRDGQSPEAFVAALTQRGWHDQAVEFLAYWLPKREAVWWGCQCIWHVRRPKPAEPLAHALDAVVHWVLAPEETMRRDLERHGQELGAGVPEGCLAYAAFYSEGSLAPAGLPEVAAPPGLTARTLTGALLLAGSLAAPAPSALRLFVSLGLDVAHGKNRWTP